MGPILTEVRTPRLKLRPPHQGDAVRIASLINEFDVARMLTRVPFPYALADAEGFVGMVEAKDPDREQSFAIEHADFGVIGVVGFHLESGAELALPELGYWLGRTFWGRGFATEAATALLRWAAESWGKRAVVAGHFADNTASGAVLCKAGFLYTGAVRSRLSLARGQEVASRTMIWLP